LGRDAESIGDAIEEGKHSSDIHCLRNLFFLPARIPQSLNIHGSGFVCSFCDQLHVFQQGSLARGETRFVKFAFDDCLYALICGSLNTQEVSVTVQSIRAPIQIGNVAGDHFFVPSRKMSFREMNRVGKLNHLSQEVWPGPKTLKDAWDPAPA